MPNPGGDIRCGAAGRRTPWAVGAPVGGGMPTTPTGRLVRRSSAEVALLSGRVRRSADVPVPVSGRVRRFSSADVPLGGGGGRFASAEPTSPASAEVLMSADVMVLAGGGRDLRFTEGFSPLPGGGSTDGPTTPLGSPAADLRRSGEHPLVVLAHLLGERLMDSSCQRRLATGGWQRTKNGPYPPRTVPSSRIAPAEGTHVGH